MAKELWGVNMRCGFKCLITGINHLVPPLECNLCITDENIEFARKEAETRRNKKMIDSFMDLYQTPRLSSVSGEVHVNFPEAAQLKTKAAKEDADTDKLTCANCCFASKSDTRVFPPRFSSSLGIYNSIPLPGGVFYCPERDTRVPGTLEGCDLHSERKKDTDGNPDEENSLDSAIDECFCEMKRLIDAGMQVGVDLASEESKTAYVFYMPVDRDKQKDKDIDECFRETERLIDGTSKNTRPPEQLRKEAAITKRIQAERDALRVCNEKLSKDNEALRGKVSFLKANSKVITRYTELQDKDLEQRYEELSKLKETVHSLEKELAASKEEVSKLCIEIDATNLDLAAHQSLNLELEAKLARIKENCKKIQSLDTELAGLEKELLAFVAK